MNKNLKICIISEYAHSLINGENAGGAELQMLTLAKELSKMPYDIYIITFGKSDSGFKLIGPLNVYNPFNLNNSGYTHFHPKNVYKLIKLLYKINADIYIQRAGTPLTGVIALISKLTRKKFIYSSASDSDVSSSLNIKTIRDIQKIFYKIGVHLSDYTICQTQYQKNLLKNTIGKNGLIIKNIYIPPKVKDIKRKYVLWVGRIVKEKRPDLYLDLAQKLPDNKFVMVGSPSEKNYKYYDNIKICASKIDNLKFVGPVKHNDINNCYSSALILVNTSPLEGFPNTFLEAGGNQIPIVSFVNPDNILTKFKLGLSSQNFEELVKNTENLLNDKSLREKMGFNGRKYVLEEHNITKIINEYERLFKT